MNTILINKNVNGNGEGIMKKLMFSILSVVIIIFMMSSCSKKENKQIDIFYGETEKWLVMATKDNKFEFVYKGNQDDLKKNNNSNNISFAYGTTLGTTIITEPLKDTTYYQEIFKANYIPDLENSRKTSFIGNKFVNVQISYAKTKNSIDLAPYIERKTE